MLEFNARMNACKTYVLFAHGENGLGFALLRLTLLLWLYLASIRTLLKTFKGQRTFFMIVCAWMAAIVGGIGSVGSLIDTRFEDIESTLLGVLFSGFLLLAGVVALLKMKRSKERTDVLDFDQEDPKMLAPRSGKVTEEGIVKAIREDREQSQ
jgi:hypothetical protein